MRFNYAMKENIKTYVGAAYEHEFDSRVTATTNGYAIAVPSLKGGTGIGELGLTIKPSPSRPIFLDVGVQGHLGKREGVAGTLRFRYDF
jgi:outer membrane autotransporter protein